MFTTLNNLRRQTVNYFKPIYLFINKRFRQLADSAWRNHIGRVGYSWLVFLRGTVDVMPLFFVDAAHQIEYGHDEQTNARYDRR